MSERIYGADTDLAQRLPDRDAALRQAIEASPVVGDGPHIWVGTVDDYWLGQPWGRWVAAARPAVEVERDVATMVARAPTAGDPALPKRWHVFSHDGFGRHAPEPDMSLHEIVRRAELFREDGRAYAAWAWLGGDDAAWLHRFFDVYQGRFDRLQDWVTLQVEAADYDRLLDRVVPDIIRPHVEINVESLAHELRASGAVVTAKDPERPGVFVFRLH